MLVRIHGDNPCPRSQHHFNGRLENMTITNFSELVLFLQDVRMSGDNDTTADMVTVTFSPSGDGEARSMDIPLTPAISDLDVVDISLHQSVQHGRALQLVVLVMFWLRGDACISRTSPTAGAWKSVSRCYE